MIASVRLVGVSLTVALDAATSQGVFYVRIIAYAPGLSKLRWLCLLGLLLGPPCFFDQR